MTITWNWDDYPDDTNAEFVKTLSDLIRSEECKDVFRRGKPGKTSLTVKHQRTDGTIVEYWPEDNKIIDRPYSQKEVVGIPKDLLEKYHDVIIRQGQKVLDSQAIVAVLKEIAASLKTKR